MTILPRHLVSGRPKLADPARDALTSGHPVRFIPFGLATIALGLLLSAILCSCGSDTQTQCQPIPLDCGTADDLVDARADGEDLLPDESDIVPRRTYPDSWTVQVSPTAPEAIRITVDDLVETLIDMGLSVEIDETTGEPACIPGQGIAVLLGDGLGEVSFTTQPVTDQTYGIAESDCEGGVLVALYGEGLLGRQYAGYEWLHQLGVRYFHPEQEYLPLEPVWPDTPIQFEHTPAFRFRSTSLHLTHPLAIGDAFAFQREEYLDEGRRFIEWELKNRASYGRSGIGTGSLADYGLRRGFPRSAGISLHNQQQGGSGVIDPDDPRTEEDQIAAAIHAVMGTDPDSYPLFFSFSFNPSEFTEVNDLDVVRQITFIGDYMAQHYPDTLVITTNHGTAGQPTEHYGVRYFDLPRFAPPNVGVKVHPLMFYDLFRPAPVYGNENFQFLYDFMVDEYQTRQLWYFPEAAWWLTFDIPVPLYLPITIEARDRDIQAIAFMLDGKLDGHRTFGTGHEWGYWQNEYCSLRMAADLTYRYWDCLEDITSTMGDAARIVQEVLEQVISLQERDILYGSILRYLVGTDPETELAASIGVAIHPLPPAPREIMQWDLEELESWLRRIGPELVRMDSDYRDLVSRLRAIEALVPENGRPWFDEILDGIEVTGLRARHAYQVYGAVVTLRLARLRFDDSLQEEAETLLEEAFQTTEDVVEVIRRRETDYRYHPLERYIAGGPQGDQDENWTIYTYRELNRTHWAYYYTRIDGLAEQVFTGGDESVVVADTVLGPDELLVIDVIDDELTEVSVTFGDDHEADGSHFEHQYEAPGLYQVSVQAQRSGEPFSFETQIAQLVNEYRTGFSGRVIQPEGAEIIEGVFPGLVFGDLSESEVVLGFDVDDTGTVGPNLYSALDSASDEALVHSQPARIVVPVVSRSTGTVMTSIVVEDAELLLASIEGPATMKGNLLTQAVIDALVDIGGFDEEGARRIVASTLGYTPDSLPEEVSFLAEFDLP